MFAGMRGNAGGRHHGGCVYVIVTRCGNLEIDSRDLWDVD